MNSRRIQTKIIAASILAAVGFAPLALSAANKPKYTIKEVMKEIHKGDDNIGKRAIKGQASKEDITKMVEYYASLPLNDPPRGDKADWLERTTAMVKASQDLKKGAVGAIEHYKQVTDCKGCHQLHKPEDKDKAKK